MGQQISIDPTLWAKTRRQAFDMGRTASSIVEEALTQYFRAIDAEPLTSTAEAMRDPNPMSFSAEGTLVKMAGPGATSANLPYWPEEQKQMDALAPAANEVESMFPKELVASVVINTPEEAAAIARSLSVGREIHPVPKPTSQKKPRR